MKRVLTLSILVSLVASSRVSFVRAAEKAEMAKKVSANPDPALKKLEIFVGDWTYEGEQVDPPISGLPFGPAGKYSGTSKARFIMNGFFLETIIEDHNPSGFTVIRTITGYEKDTDRYVANTFMSDGTRETSTMTASADARVWTTRSTMETKEGKEILLKRVDRFSANGSSHTSTVEASIDSGKTWKHWFKDQARTTEVPTPKEKNRNKDEDAASKADSEWESQEWVKLIGDWRAPGVLGFSYRIKRITKGQEVIEYYNTDGELRNPGGWKSTMKIERHHGLNFFTVRASTPNQHTSIYKVHDGKWYEQRQGIFAENKRNLAPDAFIIYERIEE